VRAFRFARLALRPQTSPPPESVDHPPLPSCFTRFVGWDRANKRVLCFRPRTSFFFSVPFRPMFACIPPLPRAEFSSIRRVFPSFPNSFSTRLFLFKPRLRERPPCGLIYTSPPRIMAGLPINPCSSCEGIVPVPRFRTLSLRQFHPLSAPLVLPVSSQTVFFSLQSCTLGFRASYYWKFLGLPLPKLCPSIRTFRGDLQRKTFFPSQHVLTLPFAFSRSSDVFVCIADV